MRPASNSQGNGQKLFRAWQSQKVPRSESHGCLSPGRGSYPRLKFHRANNDYIGLSSGFNKLRFRIEIILGSGVAAKVEVVHPGKLGAGGKQIVITANRMSEASSLPSAAQKRSIAMKATQGLGRKNDELLMAFFRRLRLSSGSSTSAAEVFVGDFHETFASITL